MIHVTYTRDGQVFSWLQCHTLSQLEKWMQALLSMGPIFNVKIEVK